VHPKLESKKSLAYIHSGVKHSRGRVWLIFFLNPEVILNGLKYFIFIIFLFTQFVINLLNS